MEKKIQQKESNSINYANGTVGLQIMFVNLHFKFREQTEKEFTLQPTIYCKLDLMCSLVLLCLTSKLPLHINQLVNHKSLSKSKSRQLCKMLPPLQNTVKRMSDRIMCTLKPFSSERVVRVLKHRKRWKYFIHKIHIWTVKLVSKGKMTNC